MKWSEPSFPNLKSEFSALPPSFYFQNTVDAAMALLGKGILVLSHRKPILCEIVEVEAYLEDDPASHSYLGLGKRNWPMFESGGTCYVYLCYGVNFCMNVVTREKGCGEAILLRSARPIRGVEIMAHHRKMAAHNDNTSLRKLLSGPGKLTEALGIDLSYNGISFFGRPLSIVDLGNQIHKSNIVAAPRIGISKAKDKKLRFYIKESSWVSRSA